MKPTRILVVEDEGVIGRDVQNTLVQLGYVVPDVARTGEEALELVGRIEPDLVLMDIRLSGEMDGIETAVCVRLDLPEPVKPTRTQKRCRNAFLRAKSLLSKDSITREKDLKTLCKLP